MRSSGPTGPGESGNPVSGDTRSDLSGSARDVVQARDIGGGVHFHYSGESERLPPRELPRGTGHFVDRVEAVGELDDLLARQPEDGTGVVHVIAGTAGVGKTSLALHWSHRVRERFPDGQLYVNLRGYDPGAPVTSDEALEGFLRSLGVPAQTIPADVGQKSNLFRSMVAGRRLLVVLDNAASVSQVRPLLPADPNTVVLVTSRNRLSGLVVRDGAHRSTVGVLGVSDAVELLRSTTRGHRPEDDPAQLAELARLCACLPLALRIAAERAARSPAMPLAELIQDLRDESALWEALSTQDEDEADAVRSVFAWSFRALPDDAARLFRLLGLLPFAEFSVHAVAALAGVRVDRTRHPLDVLAGAHLLDGKVFGRYEFHDLLRAYATEQARQEVGIAEQAAATERLWAWYLHTARACAGATAHDTTLMFPLEAPPDGVEPLAFTSATDARRWLEEERTALVAVVRAAAGQRPELAWRLAAVLERIYASHHYLRDWHDTSLAGLQAARACGERAGEALMCESLGRWNRLTMRLDEAASLHRSAAELHTLLGDGLSTVKDLNGLGWVELFAHRLGPAHEEFSRALGLVEGLGAPYWTATVSYSLGYTCVQLGRLSEGGAHLLRALTLFRSLDDPLYVSLVLSAWSLLERDLGFADLSRATAQHAVDISRQTANTVWEATTLLYLGKAQRAGGRAEDALVSYQRSAVISRQEGDESREAIALEGTGGAYQDLARPQDAVAFHRRAAAVHRRLGDRWKLSKSLSGLADALDHGEAATGEADALRQEALALLDAYPDPKSAARRTRLQAALERGR